MGMFGRGISTTTVSYIVMIKSKLALNKKLLTLFWDSIELIEAATKATQFSNGSLIRGSIIASALSVECAANICIDSLKLSKEIYNEIEKINIIGKFNYYVYAINKKTIDKSRNEYYMLKSIIKIRNNYVHPKVDYGEFNNNEIFAQFGLMQNDLPVDIRIWNVDTAIMILNYSVKFFNYYFRELCNYTKGKANTLLTSFEETISSQLIETYISISPELHELFIKYIKEDLFYLYIIPEQKK